jgi:Type II secretion system protein B
MSLILDALKRAERDRDLGDGVPDLRSLHQDLKASHVRDLWLVGMAAVVVILLLLLAGLTVFWVRSTAPTETVASLSSVEQASSAGVAPAGSPASSGMMSSMEGRPLESMPTNASPGLGVSTENTLEKSSLLPGEQSVNPEIQALYEVQYGDLEVEDPVVSVEDQDLEPTQVYDVDSVPDTWDGTSDSQSLPSAEEALADSTSGDERSDDADQESVSDYDGAASDLDQNDPQTETAQPRESTVDEGLARALWEESRIKPVPDDLIPKPAVAAVEKEPEPEVDLTAGAKFEDTLAAVGDLPFLHDLPVNTQNRIPTLMYARHQFDQQTVTINKKSFVVGDAVASNLIIERILADGVVLNFKGEKFKLAALSSWVNY